MNDLTQQSFSVDGFCRGVMAITGKGTLKVTGHIKVPQYDQLVFWAANPPDYLTSYSGSGLPFPNSTVAYHGTPNRGIVKLSPSGAFELTLLFPNAYYAGLGTVYQKPHLNLQLLSTVTAATSPVFRIPVGNGIPFRTLTYPDARRTSFFYDGARTLPIRTSEGVLRDSAYPCKNKMPPNFWGLRPPSA